MNWKSVIWGSCGSLLLLFLIFAGQCGMSFWGLKQTGAYPAARHYIETSPIVRKHCGEPREMDLCFWDAGEGRIVGDKGRASLNFAVKGTRVRVRICVGLKSIRNEWVVVDAILLERHTGEKIDLMQSIETEPTTAPAVGVGTISRSSYHLFSVFGFLAFSVWLFACFSLVQMVHRKKQTFPWSRVVLSCFTLEIYNADNLTREALPYRRRVCFAAALFILILAAAALCFFVSRS